MGRAVESRGVEVVLESGFEKRCKEGMFGGDV